MLNNKIFLKSLLIALVYVGIGTLSLVSMYPKSPIYTPIAWIGFLITFPVTISSFGIMYTEPNSLEKIVVVQLLTFIIVWAILYIILLIKSRSSRSIK